MRLRYDLIPTQASWIEYLYAGEVRVVGGEAETDDPHVIDVLLVRGFVPVEEPEAPVADEATPPPPPAEEPEPAEEPAVAAAKPGSRKRGTNG